MRKRPFRIIREGFSVSYCQQMRGRLSRRPSDFKNIIFDLGGVILNLDYQLTIRAFEELGIPDFVASYSQRNQSALFDGFERGEIEPARFRDSFRRELNCDCTDHQLDFAWNAMLLDLPSERVALLEELNESKRIFLLSNTNRIHVEAFEADIAQHHGMESLIGLFEEVYYSCDVGMRKPEERIFRMVMETNRLRADETLFIDDSPQHVQAARSCGIEAYHLTGGETIQDLFINSPDRVR